MTVSERLTQIMTNNSLSQYRLAKESGVSQSMISAILRGDRKPTVETMDMICKALNISLAQFFTEPGLSPSLPDDEWEVVEVGMTDGSILDISDLPEEAREELNTYLEFLKQRYNK